MTPEDTRTHLAHEDAHGAEERLDLLALQHQQHALQPSQPLRQREAPPAHVPHVAVAQVELQPHRGGGRVEADELRRMLVHQRALEVELPCPLLLPPLSHAASHVGVALSHAAQPRELLFAGAEVALAALRHEAKCLPRALMRTCALPQVGHVRGVHVGVLDREQRHALQCRDLPRGAGASLL